MKISAVMAMCLFGLCGIFAQEQKDEFAAYRLLSLSQSEKLLLVSHRTEKTKYLLDAATARITMNGTPVEFDELQQFSTIQMKIRIERSKRRGITIDGIAIEIMIPDK